MKRTIALVTDFGLKSAYVGILKGVIWSINPEVNIVDLCHDIDLGDIVEAFYIIGESIEYFPSGTVFVAVVDPGVGSSRRIIAIDHSDKIILAPDNGLAGLIFRLLELNDTMVYSITNEAYFLDKVSNTFHGRDIFAPVAAWITSGVELKQMGCEVDPVSLKHFDLPAIKIQKDDVIEGEIVRIDAFGNLITNISGALLKSRNDFWSVKIEDAGIMIHFVSSFYAQAIDDEPIALVGSSGYLEIAVKNSSAKDKLALGKGSKIQLLRN